MTICSRRNCTKTLRSSNTTGMCASGCLSPEAPASLRAKDVEGGKPKQQRSTTVAVDEKPDVGTALARFRAVHTAMGIDPEPVLEEFCTTWLDGIRQALEG